MLRVLEVWLLHVLLHVRVRDMVQLLELLQVLQQLQLLQVLGVR